MADGTDTSGSDPGRRPRRSELTPRERRRRRRAAGAGPTAGRRTARRSRRTSSAEPTGSERQSPREMVEDAETSPRRTQAAGPARAAEGEAPPAVPAEPPAAPARPPGSRPARASDGPSDGPGGRELDPRRARRRVRPAWVVVVLVIAVAAGGAVAVVTGAAERATQLVSPDDEAASAGPGGQQSTAVVLVTGDVGPGGDAHGIAVLAYDGERHEGSIVLIPPSVVADIPGYGTFPLAEAYAAGGAGLVEVSLANLLGLRFDSVATISPAGWEELLTRTGGFEIDVRREVAGRTPDGEAARFVPGPQQLDGPALADYLTLEVEGESGLDALPRVQRVLLGLLDHLAQEPAQLDRLLDDGATPVDTDAPDALRRVFEHLAAARADGELATVSLPVRALGTDGEDGFRLDEDRAATLTEDRLSAWSPDVDAADGRRIQILNGNGIPQIGQHVAGKLSGGGYRVVLTGNADRFTYEQTRIILHVVDDAQLEIAQDVQERLGTGVIERAATPQSVVDITIVVGADITPDD